jgi:NAD(P)-dependent dehydrogenase (short-subunit alcohol dehydrogenase family)
MTDTCVVVTGASGPLGRVVALRATSDPRVARVICVHNRSNPDTPGPDTLSGVDLSTEEGVERLSTAVAAAGCAQLSLIHCAGSFPPFRPLHQTSLDAIAASFGSNTLSFIGALQATLPHMRKATWGRILAFSSHTAAHNYPYAGAFNIAKAALESAVRMCANENARFGIAANTILAATLQTEPERELKPDGRYDDWVALEDLAMFALDTALSGSLYLNGSALHFWRYSDSYFGTSVLDRNSIRLRDIDPE